MKITEAKVIVTCPGRNFVTLKIVTDEGLYGLGDATLNGRELAVASYLKDHVAPLLIGRDPRQIEDIWHYLAKGAYWRRGPVTMAAIAAVDTALWDIKAKVAGMPLYQLLGGKSRDGVMVYGHANGRDIAETIDAVGATICDKGYKAVRAQSGVPGLDDVYGVARGKLYYEPAVKGLAEETIWSTEKYLDFAPKLFDARAREVRLRLPPAPRRASSADADRGGAPRQEPRALSPVLAGGPDAGGEPGGASADPPAHRHADRHRRGVQLDPRLPRDDREPAHRLHPHGRRACRRHHAASQDRDARGALPGADRLPRRDRPVADLHGRGAALRSLGAEFRHPGVHAPHRRDRRGLSARLHVSATAISIPATRPATASTSTRSSPRNTNTTRPICRSPVSKTGQCGAGEADAA